MKKLFSVLIIGILLQIGCKSVKSTASGLDNQSFIVVLGNPDNYSKGVEIIVDDKPSFMAKVNKVPFKPSSDKIYAINPGVHKVTIKNAGIVVYKQDIFVSTRETKKITLP